MTQEITENKQRLASLEQAAQLDHLTQLLNRKGFDYQLSEAVERARVEGSQIALLYIDLDGFKAINDTHGHAVGADLLTAFGRRLSGQVRSSDRIARLGGDEFALLLPRVHSTAVVERLGSMVVGMASTPFELGGIEVRVGASVGVATGNISGAVGPKEIKNASDAHLYQAKRTGKGRYVMGSF